MPGPAATALLLAAAFAAGGLNAVAGGGSFLSFPALVFAGVPPINANATSTLALWPGSCASLLGYRGHLSGQRRAALYLCGASLLGGVTGAVLLVRTPERAFEAIVPALLLSATLIFMFAERITPLLRRVLRAGPDGGLPIGVAAAAQLLIAVYGGYFGGGMGIFMLALYALMGMRDLQRMNGLKSLTAVLLNGVAVATFAASGAIAWGPGLLMAGASIAGGYLGARSARRIDPRWIRRLVVAMGLALSAVFLARALRG